MTWRILIVDDHQVLREGIRSLLENRPDMEVVAEADDGRLAVSLSVELSPDLVLLDISMPGLNGLEATAEITARCANTKVLALSVHSDRRYVVGMFEAGASGYLVKSCAFEELTRAIEAVCRGQTYLCPEIAGVVVDSLVKTRRRDTKTASPLTNREQEVLQLVAEGSTTKNIAAELNLSIKTVDGHRSQIMAKLGLTSVAELTKYAVREGLTSLDA